MGTTPSQAPGCMFTLETAMAGIEFVLIGKNTDIYQFK
jgi:hypothetical protein